jgi:ABC-2 type transport system permease protein
MFISIARKELRIMLKEKGTFFWLFILPILFIVLFGSVLGNASDTTVTVHYADEDRSTASQAFLKAVGDIHGFQLQQDESLSVDDQVAKIRDGKLTSLLVIPKGFETQMKSGSQQAGLTLYRDAAADSAVAPIQAVLQNISVQYRETKLTQVLATSGKSDAELKQVLMAPIRIDEEKQNASSISVVSQIVPGYTVMFVFFIMISMVKQFMRDKESGMISRLKSTPMRPIHYLIGMWIPNIVVVLIQSSVLLGFGHFVYDLHLGDVLSLAALVLMLAICGTGFGLALALFARSENQGMGITQLITMGGAVLGGLWFPTEFMPKVMQIIGKFTPQYWAQHGLQDVMVRGAHLSDLLAPLGVLALFALAALGLASMRFKKFMESAAS